MSDGEIYRKVSFEIPDYLSDGTAIKRIALESTMDAYGNSRNDKKYIDDPELIEEFMKTVRKAAANQDPSVIVPVGSYETYWCALEFYGINGAFNIGFIRSTADGHYGFSSVERDREYISDPYGFISLPEELQKLFVF
ncbi:MAG: hypothetical protein IJB86_00270 [Clostridia bacterium]|nr:hypothetical protein [Clostridia bacterium]